MRVFGGTLSLIHYQAIYSSWILQDFLWCLQVKVLKIPLELNMFASLSYKKGETLRNIGLLCVRERLVEVVQSVHMCVWGECGGTN